MFAKRYVTVLVLAGLLTTMLFGCGGQPAATPATPAKPAVDPKVGGRLVWGNPYGPTTFDPVFCNEEGGINVIHQVFLALLARDADNNLIPSLALSYENPDNLTWVFKLRKGVMWHDDNAVFEKGKSREVTAADVKYTFERILDPATKSPRIGLISNVAKVEVVDTHTVKITTKQPDAFLAENLPSVYIIPKEAIDKLGPEKFARNPVGSGPFKFVEFVPDSHVRLVRNDLYWNKPYLDELLMKVIPDQNVLLVALESNDVQVARLIPSPEVPRIKADSRYRAYPTPTSVYRYAAFNCEKPLFKDPKVRRALALALDIDSGIKAIFPEGVAIRAYGPVPKGILGWDNDLKDLWQGGKDKAKQELEALGWKPGPDGILQKDGQKMQFTIKTSSMDPNRQKFAVIISQQWKEIGVKADVLTLEWGTLVADANSGNTDVFVLGGYSGASGMGFLFHSKNHGAGGNSSRYTNKQVDELIDKGSVTVDAAQREKIWKQAQRLIVSEYAHIPLYHELMYQATSARVNEYIPSMTFNSVKNNTWLTKN